MVYTLENKDTKKVIVSELSLKKIGELLGIVKTDGERKSLADTYDRRNFYKGWRIDFKVKGENSFDSFLKAEERYDDKWEVINLSSYTEEEAMEVLEVEEIKMEERTPLEDYAKNIVRQRKEKEKKAIKLKKPIDGKRNVLCIGDLHIPFEHKGALAFCKEVMANNDITDVIFMGDLIDLHYSSYHDQDPDGMSAGYELEKAIATVDNWVKVFPEATLLLGNHDRIASRKAFSSGLSKRWIRTIDEVLNLRKWDVVTSKTIGNFFFNHGEQGVARTKCRNLAMSVVQGHLHSDFFCDIVSTNRRGDNFAIQTGCLVDHESYAMAYAKNGKPMKKGLVIIEDIESNPTVKMITMPQKFKDMAK